MAEKLFEFDIGRNRKDAQKQFSELLRRMKKHFDPKREEQIHREIIRSWLTTPKINP